MTVIYFWGLNRSCTIFKEGIIFCKVERAATKENKPTMLLSAIALTFASSALMFVISPPQMPFYQVLSPRLVSVAISSITNLELNAKFLAGISVENSNLVGAEIHSALVDLYYPDWNGLMQHIGYVEEANKMFKNMENGTLITKNDPSKPPQPIIKVHPRNISISEPDTMSIFIRNIRPSTYLNIMKDVYKNWGSIDILSSGVAHVKSPLGISLSLGVICDNTINLFSFPLKVIGKECSIDGVIPGWTRINEHSARIRLKALKIFQENDEL